MEILTILIFVKAFVWVGSPGIFYGDLVFGGMNLVQSPNGSGVISDATLKELPPPKSCVITEFHFIVLWQDRLQAISRITKETVYEYSFKRTQQTTSRASTTGFGNPTDLIGLACDVVSAKPRIFAFCGNCVYDVRIKDEEKNVWNQYLKINQFNYALKFAKTAKQKDLVYVRQAEHHFKNDQYTLAAKFYAQSSRPFEEIVLKFVEKNQHDALRNFLTNKLRTLTPQQTTQTTMITTWLTELYLDKLNELTLTGGKVIKCPIFFGPIFLTLF